MEDLPHEERLNRSFNEQEKKEEKALESNQLSAAIGSLNLMHRITIEAAEKKANKPYHGNCKF